MASCGIVDGASGNCVQQPPALSQSSRGRAVSKPAVPEGLGAQLIPTALRPRPMPSHRCCCTSYPLQQAGSPATLPHLAVLRHKLEGLDQAQGLVHCSRKVPCQKMPGQRECHNTVQGGQCKCPVPRACCVASAAGTATPARTAVYTAPADHQLQHRRHPTTAAR